MPGLTRGPLPKAVYWRRRAVVLGGAVVFIVILVLLLRSCGGGDASPTAALGSSAPVAPSPSMAVTPSESPSAPSGSTSTSPSPSLSYSGSPLPTTTPGGPCQPTDVDVTPSAVSTTPGSPVTITLSLSTTISSCVWKVAPSTMQVAVSKGGSVIWSTYQCRSALPAESVTLTSAAATKVTMVWSGRQADDDCSSHAAWAGFGTYTLQAAALGGQPGEGTFELAAPSDLPSPSTSATSSASASATGSASAGSTPSGTTRRSRQPQ